MNCLVGDLLKIKIPHCLHFSDFAILKTLFLAGYRGLIAGYFCSFAIDNSINYDNMELCSPEI